ncbi:MAG: acyltransferase family protein [Deltaproteobacteria bacterium]|nr:MAG: acyltransferase family protein [Deltaproteobacteria bacterium]
MADSFASRTANPWSRARRLAERTPESRNRYVDFLRAASILVVVIGHWLMAAPHATRGELTLGDMLHVAPWTQWLTWVFQVMPLFFIVGGYSNAVSWESARRSGVGYAGWASTRLRRLVAPLVPLLVFWSLLAVVAGRTGVKPQTLRIGSQAALIPTWFLAVYVMVVVAAPATHALWRRFGITSFFAFAAGAVAVDAVAFAGGISPLRWVNYVFVWLGVHQLGYAWRDGRIAGTPRTLAWSAAGLAVLLGLVFLGSYPVSMISVPGEAVSNSRPPTLALLALGVFHGGLVLAAEAPARRWLRRLRPWTAAVLVNGTIMTLYLWHATTLVLVVGLANLFGGVGLGLAPATSAWWITRVPWIVLLSLALLPFLAVFGRFEQQSRAGGAGAPAAWRTVAGAALLCAGMASLALGGIGGEGPLGLRLQALVLTFLGFALILTPRAGGRSPALTRDTRARKHRR